MTGLTTEAQARYSYVASLLRQDFTPPARIVELGSAPGDQIAQLAREGYAATSVDIGESSDEWGTGESGRMTRLLDEAGVEDVHWNLEVTPYPLSDNTFDAVIMTEVYEHLRDYPIKSLYEVARVLRPHGRLYLTTPNQAYLMNRLRLLSGRNVQTPLHDWISGVPFARHAREYLHAEMTALVELAGLRVVRQESRHFHIAAGRTSTLHRAAKLAIDRLSTRRPTLGPQIIIVAEKRPTMATSGTSERA